MNPEIFCGTIPALMTPCKADRTPDFDKLVEKARELVSLGMSAVVYCGSMGDWPLLTNEWRMEGVERLVKAGIKVVVGTGAVNTATAAAPGDTGRCVASAVNAAAGTFSNSVVMAAQRSASRASPSSSR